VSLGYPYKPFSRSCVIKVLFIAVSVVALCNIPVEVPDIIVKVLGGFMPFLFPKLCLLFQKGIGAVSVCARCVRRD